MTKHFRNASLTLLFLGLVGCSNSPRSVDASIPLVDSSTFVSDEPVQTTYWKILNNPQKNQFIHHDYLITLTPPYFSALGTTCRRLTFYINNNMTGSRIACANSPNSSQSQWFLTKPLTNEQPIASLK